MQHVDEGRLHAWLDGELPDEERAVERHLEECESCRARADEERRIRSAASSILLGADPGEIAMRRMVAVPAARRPRPWVAVGWAASVLLALGIGWMARPSEREPVAIAPAPAPPRAPVGTVPELTQGATDAAPVEPMARSAPAATDLAAPSVPSREERVVRPDPEPTREAAPAPSAEPPPAEVPAPVASVAVVPMPEMLPPAAPPPPPPPPPLASAPPAARRGRSASEAPVSASPPPPSMERVYAVEPPPMASPPPLAVEVVETVTLRGRVTGAESGVALSGVQVSVPALGARTFTRADGSYDLTLPAERLAGSDTIRVQASVVGRAPQSRVLAAESGTANFTMPAQAIGLEGVVVTRSAVRWRPSARADAERHLRHPLVIVPGLEVLGIEVGRVDGRTAVRVRQRLPGGETLSLTQRRAPVRADTPGEGVTIRRGRLVVEATAPIPADSIRKLF